MKANGAQSSAEQSNRSNVTTKPRWWLIASLSLTGVGLCVGAFLLDARGWVGLGPEALLEFGGSIGLVGALFIIEPLLVRHIRELQGEVVTVNAYVRRSGGGAEAWDVWTVVRPNEELEYGIRFENVGDRTLRDVMVGDNLPNYMSYVKRSARLRNGANPLGVAMENENITRGGINVGHYEPGAVGYVCFRAVVASISAFEKIGTYDVRNVAVVRPAGMNEHYNIAKVLIDVPGP